MTYRYLGPTKTGGSGTGAYADFQAGSSRIKGLYIVAYAAATNTPVSGHNRFVHVPVSMNVVGGAVFAYVNSYGQYGPSNNKNGHLYVGSVIFERAFEPAQPSAVIDVRVLLPTQIETLYVSGQVVDGLTVDTGTCLVVEE